MTMMLSNDNDVLFASSSEMSELIGEDDSLGTVNSCLVELQ